MLFLHFTPRHFLGLSALSAPFAFDYMPHPAPIGENCNKQTAQTQISAHMLKQAQNVQRETGRDGDHCQSEDP